MDCHKQNGDPNAPPYTFAGTLYDGRGGASPIGGATIHLIDGNGMDAIAVTQTNGNFWSTDPIVLPAITFVSLCPSDPTPMPTAIGGANDADCNRAGCHTSGFRVHL